MRKATKQEIKNFMNYRANHVALVQRLGRLVFNVDLSSHDHDKIECNDNDLEAWALRGAAFDNKYAPSEDDQNIFNQLEYQHKKISPHHMEYYDDNITLQNYNTESCPICDATSMPDEYLIELACDEAAVSLFKNKPIRKWYEETYLGNTSKYKLSDYQIDLLKDFFLEIEKTIEQENITYPGRNYNAKQLQESEYKVKTVAITFGRMNPLTHQHAQAIKMLHNIEADQKYVYLSHVSEPSIAGAGYLPYDKKVSYYKYFLKRYKYNDVSIKFSSEGHIMGVLAELYQEGWKNIIVVVRPAIAKVFRNIIPRYNSTIDPRTGKIGYDFDNIKVVNSGSRVFENSDKENIEAEKLLESIIRERESMSNKKSVAMTFGRMNPFTVGHLQVVKKLHEQNVDKKYVYLTHTQDKPKKKNPLACKNPLPYDRKVMYTKYFISESPYTDVEIKISDEKTIIGCMVELYKEGFSSLTVIVGSDRVTDFEQLIRKYDNVINPQTGEIDYHFDEIEVISAGERDPDAEGVEGISASKLRELAYNGEFEEFKKGVPSNQEDVVLDLYNDVRKYMGV